MGRERIYGNLEHRCRSNESPRTRGRPLAYALSHPIADAPMTDAQLPDVTPSEPSGAAGRLAPLPARAGHEEGHEEAVARKAAAGDAAAFDALVGLFAGRVFSVAVRMLNDRGEAEDLAQEVFVTLHRALPNFRFESKVSTWIYRITKNRCLNRMKFLQRRHIGHLHDVDDPAMGKSLTDDETRNGARRDPVQALHREQLSEVLEGLLRELPEQQRELVILRDLEDLSYEEIVDVTGLALGTVKSRLHRARAQLAERLYQHPSASWMTP